MMFSKDDFVKVRERIKPYVLKSPLVFSSWLSSEINAQVYLKLECLQLGRSFKLRGATNALLTEQNYTSVITASGGNHGLALSIAARKIGKPCKVVVPTSTSTYRIELMRKEGAQVIIQGEAFDEADEIAKQMAKKEGGYYVHPFADERVIQGQGTVGLEIIDQIEHPDVIIASVGGGGLLGGICLALKAYGVIDDIEIYSVETQGTESMHLSLKANEIVKLDKITSIAGTLGAKETKQVNFDAIRDHVTDSLVVSDKEAIIAMKEFLDREKLLLEPAGSCIVAAIQKFKENFTGKTVVLVICGSNVTLKEFLSWEKRFL